MLGEKAKSPPRKISVKIARAENLEFHAKGSKNKVNFKFKVTVLGGKKKVSSSTVASENGTPTFDFSCTIKLHRDQLDPLCILVEDSDSNHKGQVIIPIVKIPQRPYTYSTDQNPATSNNLLCSELEPTNKCPSPKGYLLYWIWIEDYYDEDEEASGKKSFNKSMHNLFGSKSRLSSSRSHISADSNGDSMNRIGSVSTLNKPVKHNKMPSLIKLKVGKKKDKSKSDYVHSAMNKQDDNSDVDDTQSNFSLDISNNPFVLPNRMSSKISSNSGGSYGSSIFTNSNTADYNNQMQMNRPQQVIVGNNNHAPPTINLVSDPSDMNPEDRSFSYSSYSDKGKNNKAQIEEESSTGMNFSIPSSYNDPANLQHHNAILVSQFCPTLPSSANNPGNSPVFNHATSNSQSISIANKGSRKNSLTSISNTYTNSNIIQPMNEDYLCDPSFMKSKSKGSQRSIGGSSDKSYSSDRPYSNSMTLPSPYGGGGGGSVGISGLTGASVPLHNDYNRSNNEIDHMRKENTDLKAENTILNLKLVATKSELEDLKEKLFKLRLRLLEEGATKFLEI